MVAADRDLECIRVDALDGFLRAVRGLPGQMYRLYRATDEYMRDKPEKLIEIPDQWGTVIIRKI